MSETLSLLPQRPYLFEALFEWMCDNNLTPHVVVRTDYPNVDVPMEFVKNNQIVLNLAPRAVSDFFLDKNNLSFTARFGGVSRHLFVPMGSIMAIFARENNAGMSFPPEPFYEATTATNLVSPVESKIDKPSKAKKGFKVIENVEATSTTKSDKVIEKAPEELDVKKSSKTRKPTGKVSVNTVSTDNVSDIPQSSDTRSAKTKSTKNTISKKETTSTDTPTKPKGRPPLRIVE